MCTVSVYKEEMENSILPSELLLLLLVFWGPVFSVAGFIQFKLIRFSGHKISIIIMAVVIQCAMAFAVWLSPMHKYFSSMQFMGGFSIGALPLQAGIISASLVTLAIWLLSRNHTLTNKDRS